MAKKEVTKTKSAFSFPAPMVSTLASEVARLVVSSMPTLRQTTRKRSPQAKTKRLEQGLFLDTSAIIDGRIFDVIHMGLHTQLVVIPEAVLGELKHIADSQDTVRRERGRKGLEYLERLKKQREVKVVILAENGKSGKGAVDEQLITLAKQHKGKVVTCDYNLEKRATIEGVKAINVNALAQVLKVAAVPGQALHIRVLHQGKDPTQGVGYLDDGTMVVVEKGVDRVGHMADVVVSRVIQTAAGRILFSKKI